MLVMLRKLREIIKKYTWNDRNSIVDIHLNECNGVQYVFNIVILDPLTIVS